MAIELTNDEASHLRYFNYGWGCCNHPSHTSAGSPKAYSNEFQMEMTECPQLKSAFKKLAVAEKALELEKQGLKP